MAESIRPGPRPAVNYGTGNVGESKAQGAPGKPPDQLDPELKQQHEEAKLICNALIDQPCGNASVAAAKPLQQHVVQAVTAEQAQSLPASGPASSDSLREAKIRQAYERVGLPINGATMNPRDLDATMTGSPVVLGSGISGLVYLVTLPEGQVVFKAENPQAAERAVAAQYTGIRPSISGETAPRFACRILATQALNEALGMNVILPTELALLNGSVGTICGVAPGNSPLNKGAVNVHLTKDQCRYFESLSKQDRKALLRDIANEQNCHSAELVETMLRLHPGSQEQKSVVMLDPFDPVLLQQLTNLNFLDYLSGQADRHMANVFVKIDGEGKVTNVTGIDNDMSFGYLTTDPTYVEDITCRINFNSPAGAVHGTVMPEVIDGQTYDAIMSLTADKLRELYRGLLTDREIDAAEHRLTATQKDLRAFTEDRILRSPEQWSSEETWARLFIPVSIEITEDVFQHLSAMSYAARLAVHMMADHGFPILSIAQLQEALQNLSIRPN